VIFLKVAIVTCLAGLAVALFTGSNPIAFRVVMAGCVVTLVGACWMLWVVRDPATFAPRKVVIPALIIGVGSFGGVYFWGVASPVAAMITFGIYFFSLGSNARITLFMYLVVSVLHGALILLIVTGVIADRGIISVTNLRTLDQVGVLGVIEFLYFITYGALEPARVTLEHVSKLEQACAASPSARHCAAEARRARSRARDRWPWAVHRPDRRLVQARRADRSWRDG
jgi:hypothetical protein